jgi:two-component system nitrogen regulation sensor histidine kinase NtrY
VTPERRTVTGAAAGVVSLLVVLAVSFWFLSRIHTEGRSNILVLTLVNLNLILVVVVALLLSRNLVKWVLGGRRRLKSLRTRLVAVFLGFSLVPTALLWVVASGLLNKSVDSWFSPQVQEPMQSAVELARDRYLSLHAQVANDARKVASVLQAGLQVDDRGALEAWLEAQRAGWGFTGLALAYGPDKSQRVKAGDVALPDPLPDGEMQDATTSPPGEVVRSGTPVGDWGYLVAARIIPAAEIAALRQISEQYENFSQLAAFKGPIKKGYRFSFLVIALVILFGATWFGFYVARGITSPVQRLVEGTREVAGGNLNVTLTRVSRDEVGELVEAFNTMTAQLKRNKDALTRANTSLTASNQELEARRAYMEAILENAATGVIAVDPQGRVTLFNRAAAEVLRLDPARVKERPYREAFRDMTLAVFSQLTDLLRQGDGPKQREVKIVRGGETVTLQVNARRVVTPKGDSLGVVLVFDDLTQLIRVQHEAAWREVARRLAHEIKNPLTPIQLSVQRLRKRYADEEGQVPEVVEETTSTILGEVGGLKRLVDEFSQFARMPEPDLAPQPVWGLVKEVAALYRQAYPGVRMEVDEADPGPLSTDREQMRRVFTNLFENAVQAMHGDGRIRVSASRPSEKWVEIRVADTGPGIAKAEQEEVFRPYFSRREGGTGLGLAIAQRILEEHGGRIRVEDNVPHGAVFVLAFPVA